jgi:oxygen-independent coproporphyrinogen-3 oxidase
MFRQLRKGYGGRIGPEQQIGAYERSRDMLGAAGLPEYAMSHFGSPRCLSDLAYFQLQMDWIGFGSGATSLLDARFLSTERGQLARYIASPERFDEDIPAASGSITPRLLHQSLSTWEGADAELWRERTGEALEVILAQEPVLYLLDFLHRATSLVRDARGVRIPRHDVARAFIQLHSMRIPRRARGPTSAQALLGGH